MKSLVLLFLAACAASCNAPTTASSAPSGESKRPLVEQKIEVQRAKIEAAELELESARAQSDASISAARVDVQLAHAQLAAFREFDVATRTASATLDLRGAEDRAAEAAEELAQIQIMYDEQDLDDLTREYVISRGRRNAERAAARIEITKRELERLKEHTLRHEERSLELAAERAEASLAAAERAAEIERRGKQISLQELRNGLAELERELAGEKP